VNRRQALTLLAAGAAWPAMAHAQTKIFRVGMLVSSISEYRAGAEEAFHRGMRDLGWDVGRNCIIEAREYRMSVARVPALVSELKRDNVDVFVVSTLLVALATQSLDKTTPIVVVAAGDPVSIGAAASLARPGGTITGMSLMAPELAAKRLDLLAEVLPHAARIAILQNPAAPMTNVLLQSVEAAARPRGLAVRAFPMRSRDEVASVFDAIKDWSADGVLLLEDEEFFVARASIAAAALARKLPLACPFRDMARAGCLFSYSASLLERFYRSATYVGKILKGANPAELPFEQPTRFELVINLKTAATLGLDVPATLLVDEVIE
jgi:putative tryptophan/tyrosine transport system substrate-binding protein